MLDEEVLVDQADEPGQRVDGGDADFDGLVQQVLGEVLDEEALEDVGGEARGDLWSHGGTLSREWQVR